MNRPRLRYPATLLCLVLAIVGGCNSAERASEEHDDHGHSHDHDHSDTPKTLQAAITELRDMWADISTAMDNSDPDSAHDPLHEVGKVLEAMPDLTAETDLTENQWNEIKAEADRLFDAFGDIDSAFHIKDGDKVAACESAKSTIDEGVAALEAVLPLLGEGSSTDGHGHGHDPHKDHDHDHDHHDEDSVAEE